MNEPEPPVPVPSDEAVKAYMQVLRDRQWPHGYGHEQPNEPRASWLRRRIAAAYAIDLPRLLAEARAEGEAALLKHGDNLTTATIWSEGYQAGQAARTTEIVALFEDDGAISSGHNCGRYPIDVIVAHFNPEAE